MIKLLTHNDLDGISCILLAKLAYGEDAVDTTKNTEDGQYVIR